jgi:alpha-beta hydrolase superfamily lysophospholipase
MRLLYLLLSHKLYLLALIMSQVSGCSFRHFEPTPAQYERSELVMTTATKPRGVFIVIHGLNQRPSSMDPLCQYLRSLGFHTYRLTLSGHDDRPTETFPETRWEHDLLAAYANLRVHFPTLPIDVLGYSLGGLVAASTLESYPVFSPSRMVLFAPALALTPFSQAGYVSEIVPPLIAKMPSLAPVEYKRFESTPIFLYQNTLTLYSRIRRIRAPLRLQQTLTLVFANPRDALISLSGLTDWIDVNELSSNWRLVPVHPEPRSSTLSEHLIIDQQTLGNQEWVRVTSEIRDFLSPDIS